MNWANVAIVFDIVVRGISLLQKAFKTGNDISKQEIDALFVRIDEVDSNWAKTAPKVEGDS